MLTNLTSNALKFTPEGGSVVIRTANVDGEVVVDVCDTGIGIAESDLPHVFGRFFRTAAAEESAIPGTGLGLAISRAIVEAHEGELDIAETSSGGTTFRMRLPKAAASATTSSISSSATTTRTCARSSSTGSSAPATRCSPPATARPR